MNEDRNTKVLYPKQLKRIDVESFIYEQNLNGLILLSAMGPRRQDKKRIARVIVFKM